MPNIKSAKKRTLIAEKKSMRNKSLNSNLKTAVKKFNASLTDGSVDEIQSAYKATVKKIDQSVTKGILHKNTAARKKSRFACKANEAISAQQ